MQEERADALGDVVNGHPELVEQVLPELAAILGAPDDHYALGAAIGALGRAWDARAAELLLTLVSPAHPEAEVRLALAEALPGGSHIEPCRGAAISVLTALSADVDEDVRDWACFGLGQLHADGTGVRDALAARLDDEHDDTRCEALLALAKTGDPRALAAVLSRLDTASPDDIRLLEVRAAAELADPALVPALDRLHLAWAGDSDDHTSALTYALRRCQPDQGARAAQVEASFLRAVNEQLTLAGSRRSIVLTDAYPCTLLTLLHPDGTPEHAFGSYRIWDDLIPGQDPITSESWVHTILKRAMVG